MLGLCRTCARVHGCPLQDIGRTLPAHEHPVTLGCRCGSRPLSRHQTPSPRPRPARRRWRCWRSALPTCRRPRRGPASASWRASRASGRSVSAGRRSASCRRPRREPSLEVMDVDAAFDHVAALSGSGSAAARREAVDDLFSRATEPEQAFLRALITGDVRQGALRAVAADAIAAAFGMKQADVRRALMLLGDPGEAAAIAREQGAEGLRAVELQVGRPVLPMLAGTAPDLAGALERILPAARRVEAGRRPHPGAPRRRRSRRLHPQPGRRHQPRAGDRRGACWRCRPRRSCWTARPSCCARTAGRTPSR